MSDYAAWLAANDQYLATALAGLRDRLQRAASQATSVASGGVGHAPPSTPVTAVSPTAAVASSSKHSSWLGWMFGGRAGRSSQAVQAAAPSGHASRPATSLAVNVASQDGAAAASISSPAMHGGATTAEALVPALVLLAQRLGLSDFERDLLLLCIGMELDTRMPALCAQAQHDASKPWPTFALAFAVLDDPAWDALSPERPLRYWRLLDIHQPGPQPLIGAALSADERIVNFVKGMNHLDDRLAPLLVPLSPAALPPSQQAVADRVVDNLSRVPEGEALPTVQLIGSDSTSKQAIAYAVASTLGARAYRLSADLLPGAIAEQETLVRLWQRESLLLPIALYVDAADTERGDAAAAHINRFLARAGGLNFIDTREPWSGGAVHMLSADVAKPTPVEQRSLWQRLLGEGAGDHPQQLAGHFDFSPGKIEQVAHSALAAAEQNTGALRRSLWQGALARTRPALDQLAQRIEPKARWDDIKLPGAERDLLRQIADQVAQRSTVYDDWGFRERMNRGLSISALVRGRKRYRQDHGGRSDRERTGLVAVSHRPVRGGEQIHRRNREESAQAVRRGGGGRRHPVLRRGRRAVRQAQRGEGQPRPLREYRSNYLLQRLESFRGLAILATNMKSALDSAFLRRIRFVVNFPFPGAAERKAIWASVFPPRRRQRHSTSNACPGSRSPAAASMASP